MGRNGTMGWRLWDMASFRVWLDLVGDGLDVEYGEESI